MGALDPFPRLADHLSMLGRVVWLLSVALVGCTALRPLDPDDAGAGLDVRGDAPLDAILDPDAGEGDGGAPDAGCDPSALEVCNGRDDDCDATTADGVEDPLLGAPCDGTDSDQCTEGVRMGCAGGVIGCSDVTTDTLEACGGLDEDCDGAMDEAGATGGTTYYADADGDGYGSDAMTMVACSRPAVGVWQTRGGDCNDLLDTVRPGRAEQCNAMDDNCDGMVDERACTGCTAVAYAGHTYLFCNSRIPFASAATECADAGYHLVQIEDAAENTFVATTAMSEGLLSGFPGGMWIGLEQDGAGTRYVWPDGSAATYFMWEGVEPNGTGPCVRMRTAGGWGDAICTNSFNYACEAP